MLTKEISIIPPLEDSPSVVDISEINNAKDTGEANALTTLDRFLEMIYPSD